MEVQDWTGKVYEAAIINVDYTAGEKCGKNSSKYGRNLEVKTVRSCSDFVRASHERESR